MTDKLSFEIIDYQELLSNYEGDLDLIPELVDIFFEHSTDSLPLIKKAIIDKNPEELISTAHALKSMVGNFYADPVREILITLEERGHENSFEGVDEVFADLENIFEKLRAELLYLQRKTST